LKNLKHRYTIELFIEKNQDIFVFYNYTIVESINISISNFQNLKKIVIKNLNNWFYALINVVQIKQQAIENAQYYINNEIQRRARVANVVVKYLKFKFTINNVVSERNNLKNYISTLANKFEQVTFNKNKLYQVRNYYKILLKIINNKFVKIKIEQD